MGLMTSEVSVLRGSSGKHEQPEDSGTWGGRFQPPELGVGGGRPSPRPRAPGRAPTAAPAWLTLPTAGLLLASPGPADQSASLT